MGQREAATVETVGGAVARLAVRRGSWLVGRGPDAHLRLYSDRVSPRHAWLRRDARGTWVADAGSRAGTRVNGDALAPGRARLLRDGDRLEFGPITAVYRDTAPADEAAPPVFSKVARTRGTGRVALVLGPVLVVTGFGLGASRLLRYFAAGPEVGLGGTLLTVGVVVTVLGLVLANRPQWK
ncbi:FHA domain-containing protein [Amycolatopsis sp. WQ 127309]|uniref:FHA domain-containing protein n=1 Tax=Amycolatopsis sp. WQ 127309 TaxID=2932773 RepID=UPI001FF18951|nr:FHA domain-containing protein [Amycolatopsis sp. WQ 127309]UOZ05112.1 FHA domain-containing protein [Amycolatopsis sp. WQ 127309]